MSDPGQLDFFAGRWRRFEAREIRQAYGWAAAGGVAVHCMGDVTGDAFPGAPRVFHGRRFAHLFAGGRDELVAAAKSLGCRPSWIQKDDDDMRRHFDITGTKLAAALARCR